MSKTRKISEAQAIHIRDLLVKELDAKYGPKDPITKQRPKAGQRKICEDTGLSQPVLKDIEDATGSVGVHALVALRRFLAVPIDDLLMLEPLPAKEAPREKAAPSLAAIRAVVAEGVAEAIARATNSTEPPPMNHVSPAPKGKSDAPRPRRR